MAGRRRGIAALALASILAACSGQTTEQEGQTQVEPPVDGSGRDGEGQTEQPTPTLAFSADRPPAVIVAHATAATVVAHRLPDAGSPVAAELSNPTAIGGPLAFQLVEVEPPDADWVEVHLPIRPNGSTGWVRRSEVELSRNPYRIEIDTGDHRLDVYRSNLLWLSTDVAIGTGETPTPLGRFYIIELLRPPTPTGPYGSFAFGLSGFSETLTTFGGGDGVIGIHGTNDPTSLGTDVSHGCIRVANDTIESMAGVIPLGTPVIIQP